MRTVLIIEDDPFAMKVLEATLKRCGFRTLRAPDSSSALELCCNSSEPLDLIICDVLLPGTSGPAIMLEAVECRPEVPVVFTSGTPTQGWSAGDQERLQDLRKRTHCVFLPKPFRASALMETVAGALGRERRAGMAA